MARQPARDKEADDEERRTAGVSREAWDAASAWADDEPADPAGQLRDGSFVVWPMNWRAVEAFMTVQNCWRFKPMGGLAGFDWPQVEHRLRHKGLRRPRLLHQALNQLALMEGPALREVNRG